LALAVQDEWWNADWTLRRKVTVSNHLKEPLKAGFPVMVQFNPGFLGLDRKCAPNYADMRVIYKGKEVPFYIDAVKADKVILGFRLAEEIKAKGSDAYTLYYGNKEAKPAAMNDKSGVFEFVAEFGSADDLKKFDIDGSLDATVDKGELVVKQKAAGESKIKLQNLAALSTFQFKMSLTAEGSGGRYNPGDNQITLHLRPKLQQGADPKIEAQVAALVDKLGDDEYRVREEATKAIIELGKAAVAKIESIYKETKDAEIKWRCEFILQEIAKKNPIPGISVTYTFVPDRNLLFTVSTAIAGKTTTSQLMNAQKIDLEIARMEKFRSVTIRTPAGQVVNIGELKDEIEEVWLEFKNAHQISVKIDRMSIERYLSDQGRPTYEIDIEEAKK
jgi:hypothetical protein